MADKNQLKDSTRFEEPLELNSRDLRRKSDDLAQIEVAKIQKDSENEKDIYSTVVTGVIRAFNFVKSLKLELITFLYIATYMSKSNTSLTMLMDRVCRVHLKYSDEICDNLNLKVYEKQKTNVERMSNNYHLGHILIGALPSSILACFVGPFSDRYGRRLPMIVGLVGAILDDFQSAIWAYAPHARVEWFFVPALSSTFTGGFIVAITILYSYASDITTAENRTIKFTLLEASMGFAMPAGVFAGGMIYKYYKGPAVFVTALGARLVTLLFVYFLLKETRGIGNTDTWRQKARAFFSSRNFLEGFRAAIKTRPHRGRQQLWMLLLAMSIGLLIMIGSGNISLIFTHHHYDWHNTKYSTVSSVFTVMTTVTMMIAVPIFLKVLHVSDPMLGIIGSVSYLGKMLCITFAAKSGLYYLGSFIGLLSSMASLAGRARISKIIPKSDLGKVFAFVSTAETLVPILSQIAISQMFNATLGIIPDPTYSMFSVLGVVALGVYVWLYRLPKVNYEEITEEEDRRESVASLGRENKGTLETIAEIEYPQKDATQLPL